MTLSTCEGRRRREMTIFSKQFSEQNSFFFYPVFKGPLVPLGSSLPQSVKQMLTLRAQ